MKAEIVKQTKDLVIINWESEEAGFGQLTIEYNNDGTYTIESEYMGIPTIIKILKSVEL